LKVSLKQEVHPSSEKRQQGDNKVNQQHGMAASITSLAPLKSVCRDVATRANDLLDFALLEPPTNAASSGKKGGGGGSSLPSGTAPLLQALQVQGTYYMSARSWLLHGRVSSSIAAKLNGASAAAPSTPEQHQSAVTDTPSAPAASAVHAALLAQARGPCHAARDAVGVLLQEWRARLVAVRAAAAPLYPYLAAATTTTASGPPAGAPAVLIDPDVAAQVEEVAAQVQALIAQLDDGVRMVHAICADVERHVRAATDALTVSNPDTMVVTPSQSEDSKADERTSSGTVGASTPNATTGSHHGATDMYRWDLGADQLRVYSFTLMRHPLWRLRSTVGGGGGGGGHSFVSARGKATRLSAIADFLV
jgi:hypothetical protein